MEKSKCSEEQIATANENHGRGGAACLFAGEEFPSRVGDGAEQGWANGRNPCEFA